MAGKRDLKQANKIRTKALSMMEMIVEFDSFFNVAPMNAACTFVKGINAQINFRSWS